MVPSIGSGGRASTAPSVGISVTVSSRYSHGKPTTGMSTPAISGPPMAPACITVMFSELAAGSRFSGSSRGSTALRVGWLTAKNACCTANRDSSSHTLPAPVHACSQNSVLVAIRPSVVMTSSVRRSMTSASAPPQSPKTTSGTRPKTPVRPTYAEEPVIA